MADILAFVRNTPRLTRSGSAAENGCEVVLFPGASVGMLALWEQPEDELVAAALEGRTDN